MMEPQWLVVKLVTGSVIGELPKLQCTKLEFRIGEMTSSEAVLPWDDIPRNWYDMTTPYVSAILLVQDSTVLWGGIVVKRERKLGGSGISLTLSTIEHYLDSVYIRTASYRKMSQTQIAANLIGFTSGHRLTVQTDAGLSTIIRDRDYDETQDKTILSAIQELSGVINGPEWYGTWRANEQGGFSPFIVVRDRLGKYREQAVFDETTMTELTVLEDYSTGYGANRVQATSSAEGAESAFSDWQVYTDFARPEVEYKYQAGTSIVRKDTLNQHAMSELEELKNGTITLSFITSLVNSPQPGVDWDLGDTVNYDLSNVSKYLPDYTSGVVRIIGYDLDYSQAWKLTPVLRPLIGKGA